MNLFCLLSFSSPGSALNGADAGSICQVCTGISGSIGGAVACSDCTGASANTAYSALGKCIACNSASGTLTCDSQNSGSALTW